MQKKTKKKQRKVYLHEDVKKQVDCDKICEL